MTLHTNHLRFIADKEVDRTNGVALQGFFTTARSSLTDAANEIDKLRHELSLLKMELTFAKKAQADGS
mgnify:CR=1 FL=1